MGKPYQSELNSLVKTWYWAMRADIGPLSRALRSAASLPVVAIGSGGSLTAAHLLAFLHRHFTGKLATVMTPFDIVSSMPDRDAAIWLISAGGSNRDILGCLQSVAFSEPKQLGILCGSIGSPIAKEAARYAYADFIGYSLPEGKDGFLATNSLVAFSVLLARAYVAIFGNTLYNGTHLSSWDYESALMVNSLPPEEETRPLWQRSTLIVIHGDATRIGAIDLESKFSEAALGNIQLADYRNFAHGRHYWLAKRGKDTGVLAFTTPEDRGLAEKTLALFPKTVPVVRVDFAGDLIQTALASLITSLHLTGRAGSALSIDPGRPGVPRFGERLYRLVVPKSRPHPGGMLLNPVDRAAIERKAGSCADVLAARGTLAQWEKDLGKFRRNLSKGFFSAIVFDYDGTLVDSRHRREPPVLEMVGEIIRLLQAGLLVGIATGRGKSVRIDLRKCIPHQYWGRVLVGYYNCSDIALLEDETHPDGSHETCPELSVVADALMQNRELAEIAKQDDRRKQITLEPKVPVPENYLWHIASETIHATGTKNGTVVRSSHSIDVLAPGVSKIALIKSIRSFDKASAKGDILRIGDRGQWPGNDFELLRDRYALSVDEVSTDPESCWNLAPKGCRGTQATLLYLRALKVDSITGLMRLKIK